MFRLRVLLSATLPLLCALAEKKPVTLEALTQSRPPMMGFGSYTPSPDGQTLLLSEMGGKLSLYDIASRSKKDLLPGGELSKAATPVPKEKAMGWENRRVSERPFQWGPDGKSILATSGGDIFLIHVETGKWEQLTKTPYPERDPKLSPDGTRISYRREYDLYVMELASKKVIRLTSDGSATLWNGMLDWVYPEELELGTAYWWSPDSKSIAYMQFDVSRETMYPHIDPLPVEAVGEPQRYPKAGTPNADVRVGVVAATGGQTKWMDYGETRDQLMTRVHWHPNSRQLLVHKMNRIQNRLQVFSADVESGASRLLYQESDPAWVNLPDADDFHFLKSGELLISSERDGFRHLYVIGADGKQKHQLTKGDWEVTSLACVNDAENRVYYVSSEKSPLERHLYAIGLNGRGKRQLTRGDGNHSVVMGSGCNWYLDTYSSLESPMRRALHNVKDGSEIAVLTEPDTKASEEYDLLKPEIHTFKGSDGTVFYGRLLKPKEFDPAKKYPVIVNVYGGPHAQAVRNAWMGGLSYDQVLAHLGFVVWQMDNRGSYGRGHVWEAKLHRRMGKQELDDQKEGVRYLTSLGFIDPKRVGIRGWSYGGYMTLYSLLNAPETFAAGAAGAAVTDWRNYDTIYTERYLGLPQENEEGYRLSSPVHDAAKLQGKLLLIHNLEDDNVLFANAVQMMTALQLAGKQFETVIYAQKSHGVSGKARAHLMKAETDFFVEALKP